MPCPDTHQDADGERRAGGVWQNWDLNPGNLSAVSVSDSIPTPRYASHSAETQCHIYLYKYDTL